MGNYGQPTLGKAMGYTESRSFTREGSQIRSLPRPPRFQWLGEHPEPDRPKNRPKNNPLRAMMQAAQRGAANTPPSLTTTRTAEVQVMADYAFNTVARFWSKVEVGSETQCWPWRNGANDAGYGRFKIGGRLVSPHRFAYELRYGEIPEDDSYHGTVVRHRCNNPRCVNPAHLLIGTQGDNVRDMDEAGRRNWREGPKLGPAEHLAIASDPRPQRIVAAEYGISGTQVNRIRSKYRRLTPGLENSGAQL